MTTAEITDGTVVMLVGLPGSGKSSWIEEFVSTDSRNFSETDVLSTDDYINSIAYAKGITYDRAFREYFTMANHWFNSNLDNLDKGGRFKTVIVDRTNLIKNGRAKIIRKAKDQGLKVVAVVFPIPESGEWKRRLDNRPGKNIPWPVLMKMMSSFESPSMDEGFDGIIRLKQNTDSLPIFA